MEAIRKQSAHVAVVRQSPVTAKRPAYDTRFRHLCGVEGWSKLPEAVQRRFSKRLGPQDIVTYRGIIIETKHSRLGWMLAQLCRMVGAPLPLWADAQVPAVVIISEDGPSGGQCWTRIYGRKFGFPQVIYSAKRFAGPTGLEEYLGRNLGMALNVATCVDGIIFESDHYFMVIAGKRVRLPRWLGPGHTTVQHRDLGEGKFAFDLDVDHPLFGNLLHQHTIFVDG